MTGKDRGGYETENCPDINTLPTKSQTEKVECFLFFVLTYITVRIADRWIGGRQMLQLEWRKRLKAL